jgi:hypothetical protein
LAWGDFDADGDPDLYICNIAKPLGGEAVEGVSNQLFRNNSDGTFTDITSSAGVGLAGMSMGAAWADYDGDRDLDLAVSSYPDLVLYRNQGDGTFSDITKSAGLADDKGFWSGLSWGDYDRDGDLDLYVGGYAQYRYDSSDLGKATSQYSAVVPFTLNPSSYPPEPNLLFRNEGNGRFSEVGEPAGVKGKRGRSLSATWCDFDLDGWLDLYVANDISDNVMYHNSGDGTFEDISHNSWVADYRGAMGLGTGDWDNDGDFDIFVSHWLAQENALLNNLIYAFDGPTDKAEKLLFMDIADQNGLGQIALDYIGWSTSFFDYNNDGLLDLFVLNGSTFQVPEDTSKLIPMRDLLFWNRGEEDGFFEVGELSGDYFQELHIGRGGAVADYDDDGDLDLAVLNHSGLAVVLRNEGGNAGNWLKVKLRVEGRNHFGLGARLQVTVGGSQQVRQLGSQPAYLSQNAQEVHFGLGDALTVDRLTVTLLDGTEIVREEVPVNQTVVIQK